MQNCMSLGCVCFLREHLKKFCHINLHHFPLFLALLFTHEAHFERNWRYDQTQSCVSILYCPSSMIWTVRLSICQLLCKIEAVRQVTWWSGIPSYLIWWTDGHAWFDTDLVISLKHSPERYIDASFPPYMMDWRTSLIQWTDGHAWFDGLIDMPDLMNW